MAANCFSRSVKPVPGLGGVGLPGGCINADGGAIGIDATAGFVVPPRIAELMLARAVERLDDQEFMGRVPSMTDSELLHEMGGMERARETVLRLRYRRLHKSAYQLPLADTTEEQRQVLVELSKHAARRAWEDELAHRVGLPGGEVTR